MSHVSVVTYGEGFNVTAVGFDFSEARQNGIETEEAERALKAICQEFAEGGSGGPLGKAELFLSRSGSATIAITRNGKTFGVECARSKPNLNDPLKTEWYPGRVNPVHVGWYEIATRHPDTPFEGNKRLWWTGSAWNANGYGIPAERPVWWRGISKAWE
jgi:hypothetical protein